MDIRQAIARQDIFGSAIRDIETFGAWMAFLSALFGLPMTESEAEIFRACTGRTTPPTSPASEAWLICGRRAGKSFMMALIAVFLATFKEYRQFLGIGERATVMVVAADRRQARVVLRYVRGLLKLPVFAKMVEREAAESFDLTNRVTIGIHTASIKAVRGYSIAAAICDEIAYWPQEDSASPDFEILDSIRPAMATIPSAVLICASSPYASRGALWDAHKRHFGRDAARPLVWQAATRVMNPTVPQAVIDEAGERDPASAAAEFGAQFRTDRESYLSREIIDAAIVPGRYELAPVRGIRYVPFVDPSGGASDEMVMAISHKEGETIVLDCIRARKPPFSPDDVVREFANTLESYGLHSVTGDYYGGEWPSERFRAHGIKYDRAQKPKSDIYRDAIPLFSAKRVELLDHPKLAAQLIGLERRTARGGRDSIDHAPNAHDDIANAVCGAFVFCSGGRPPMRVSAEAVARARLSPPRFPNTHTRGF
jgi:hypothetical protein